MLVPASLKIFTLTLRFCQYIDLLIGEYSLRVLPRKKPVIGLDDLYLLLYTHWVLDDSTFKDERQRVQVATGLLTAAFFGCRPCSLFDTRVKFDDPDNSNVLIDETVVAIASEGRRDTKDVHVGELNDSKSASNNTTRKSIHATGEVDGDSSDDSDSDFDSSCDYSEDCETDDDCYAGLEETRSFLYRHFTISIIANQIAEKPNLVFMKAILLHTKGEDNNPRT